MDFSTDPGWTTTDATAYHWDPFYEAYHLRMADASESYAMIPVTLLPQHSFKFEFDLNISGISWAGDVAFGLYGTTMEGYSQAGIHPFAKINFGTGDLGHGISVEGYDGSGTFRFLGQYPSSFAFNTWYHATVLFDHASGILATSVAQNSDGSVIWFDSMTGVNDFTGLVHLGASKVGYDYAPGATGVAVIDNVQLFQVVPEPSCFALTLLGLAFGSQTACRLPSRGLGS